MKQAARRSWRDTAQNHSRRAVSEMLKDTSADDGGLSVVSPIFDCVNFERLEHDGGGNLAGRLRSCSKKPAKDSISKGETMILKLACADFAFPLLPHDRVLDLITEPNQKKSCPHVPCAAKQQQK
jgi:hypothetical protein